jgi:hypothetical protein
VLSDPHSVTSPAPILERWKHLINITLWQDKDIFPNGIGNKRNNKPRTKFGMYTIRQRRFLGACMGALHKEGREWLVLTDTDEYTMINDKVRHPQNKLSPENSIGRSLAIPTQREPGSVLKFLRSPDYIIPLTNRNLVDNLCITMARKVRRVHISSQRMSTNECS